MTDKAVEAMAGYDVAWGHGCYDADHTSDVERSEARIVAKAALSALLTLYPGIKGLIEGTHVSVPREPTEAIKDAIKWTSPNGSGANLNAEIYKAMLAAAEGK